MKAGARAWALDGGRLLEGSDDHGQVLPAHWLAVVTPDPGTLPHQFDGNVRQPEAHGNGDAAVPVEKPEARVQAQAQRDLDSVRPDALGQGVGAERTRR